MSQETNTDSLEVAALLGFFAQASAKQDAPFTYAVGLVPEPSIFSVARLQDCLNNPLLSPEWLQVAVGGKAIDITASHLWKTVQAKRLAFIDKQALNSAIAMGASVVLEGLDILDAQINDLLAGLDRRLPCALSNCEAFFSQRGNEAYGGHRDSDDVLVLQISGEKRWFIHHPQQRRYFGNTPLNQVEMGPVLAELIMKPGDALFLRAGVPHRCTTPAAFSLHLSIDLCDRTPNIEQIGNAANALYNKSSAPPNVPASQVVARYVEQLQSAKLHNELEQATKVMRSQAQEFRQRIGRASSVTALAKFL